MDATLRRERLLRMRAGFLQQIDDASALLAELPGDSPDLEAVRQWLDDSRTVINRIDIMLSGLDAK